jgi:hypothetical protein
VEQSAKTAVSKNQEDVEPNDGEEPNQQNPPAKPTPQKSETNMCSTEQLKITNDQADHLA